MGLRDQEADVGPCEALPKEEESLVSLPIGSIVVPLWGSYSESYEVIPKRNYHRAYGYSIVLRRKEDIP